MFRTITFGVIKLIFVGIVSVFLLGLTAANLVYSNVFGEACGYIHPTIFQIEVTMIRANGTSISSTETSIPFHVDDTYINPEAEPMFASIQPESGEEVIGELDTYLRVYDGNGNLVAENDDFISRDSAIESLDVSAFTQPIYIEVATYLDQYRGQYILDVTSADGEAFPPVAFDAEPRTDLQAIDTIAVDEALIGTIDADLRMLFELQGESATGLINVRLFGDQTVPITATETERAVDTRNPPGLNPDVNTEDEWASCLQYYGYFDNDQFSITQNGVARYITFSNGDAMLKLIDDNFNAALNAADLEAERQGITLPDAPVDALDFAEKANEAGILGGVLTSISPITKEYVSSCEATVQGNGIQITNASLGVDDCIIDGVISLSLTGRMLFYVIIPLIVILVPVIAVLGLTYNKDRLLWGLLLVMVVIYSTTTSLLFITLEQVSGIAALQEFGTGIFGGIVTGAALGFIGMVVEIFSGKENEPEDKNGNDPA